MDIFIRKINNYRIYSVGIRVIHFAFFEKFINFANLFPSRTAPCPADGVSEASKIENLT